MLKSLRLPVFKHTLSTDLGCWKDTLNALNSAHQPVLAARSGGRDQEARGQGASLLRTTTSDGKQQNFHLRRW